MKFSTRRFDLGKQRLGKTEWILPQFVSGGLIGPVCDNFHSQYDVLQYERYQIRFEEIPFETAVWVPPLFGFAAVIIGGIALFLDDEKVYVEKRPPLLSILAFISLYFLSGILASRQMTPLQESFILWPLAFLLYIVFDAQRSTLVAGAATAVSGPMLELGLTAIGDLYHYISPDFLNLVPSWIPAVYFAGAPAVAQLARFYYYYYSSFSDADDDKQE